MNLKNLTDEQLREAFKNNEHELNDCDYRDEIVSRFMARKEVPIKELLWQSFRVAFSLGYDYNAKMGDTESLFAEWFNRSSHLVPAKPDLSGIKLTDIQNLITRAILYDISPKGIIPMYQSFIKTKSHKGAILEIEKTILL